jgi:hypothetical protein
MAIVQLVCALLVSCGPFPVYVVYIVVLKIMYTILHCGTVVGAHIFEGHCSVVLRVMTLCFSLHPWRWEHMLLNISTKLPDCSVITQVTTVWIFTTMKTSDFVYCSGYVCAHLCYKIYYVQMLKFSEWKACILIVRSCLSFSRSSLNVSLLLEIWFVRPWNILNEKMSTFICLYWQYLSSFYVKFYLKITNLLI